MNLSTSSTSYNRTSHVNEVIQAHTPLYTKRAQKSITFIVRWLNNLRITPGPLTPKTIFKELTNGLVLLALCELLLGVKFDRFERKPIARKACLNNIEAALSCVWKKNVCASHMCTAEDVYDQNTAKVTSCLLEIMEVAVFRDIRASAVSMIEDLDSVLIQCGHQLNPQTKTQPIISMHTLVEDFCSGIRCMLVLCLRGVVDMSEISLMRGNPTSSKEYLCS